MPDLRGFSFVGRTGMVKIFQLTLLRPIERFLAQWISVSTEPTTFVRERVRLGDTTNFAAGRILKSEISLAVPTAARS
jgi:hypothetical protein